MFVLELQDQETLLLRCGVLTPNTVWWSGCVLLVSRLEAAETTVSSRHEVRSLCAPYVKV